MAAPRNTPLRLILLLVLVSCIWAALDYFGALGTPRNIAEDLMFQFRGQIPAYDITKPGHPPLKVMYVDVDARTVGIFGERPWSRECYALIMDGLFTYGHAKAVGFDFLLSPAGMKSSLLDSKKVHQSDMVLGAALERFPNAVIAAAYSNTLVSFDLPSATDTPPAAQAPDKDQPTATSPAAASSPSASLPEGKADAASAAKTQSGKLAEFPYIYQGDYDPSKNAYPECPTYPLISFDRMPIGLIDVATEFNADDAPDNVPRWIPLFAETKGTQQTDNIVYGYLNYNGYDDSFRMDQDDKVMILNPNGGDPLVLPKIQDVVFYNLSVKLALAYLGLDDHNIQRSANALDIVDKAGKTLIHIPLVEHQLVEVNWFSKWDNPQLNPRVSAADVIKYDTAQAQHLGTAADATARLKFFEQFKDAIVLVGPVDPILQDLAPTPFDSQAVPKVGVYGNLLKTFFSGQYIHRTPPWIKLLLLFALTMVIGSLATYGGKHSLLAKLATFLLLAAYILGVFEAFAHFNIVLPLIAPTGSAFSAALVGVVWRLIEEEKQKKRIKGMFGTYISPELVNKMVESGEEPKLGGEQLTISIFFSDVQGFSSFSEVLTPEKLVELMNEYLTAMTDILQAESGTLDKYIGDAVVAMYGAPIHVHDNAIRACVSACRMQTRLGELRQKWIHEGDKWPPLVHKMRCRIGLNTGPAVVGNMGSSSRFNYTMMGDDVNLGARLESGAKQFGVYTMCSEATKTAAEKIETTVLFRRLNRIKVKGRSTPVEVYEVVGLRQDASPDTLRCVEIFERGLDCYFAQQWDEAIRYFAESEKLEPLQPGVDAGVEHNPSELMQKVCAEMKRHPPEKDWDGVYEMTSK